jgi:hypothetical protein
VLAGASLSQVQELGAQMLMLLDRREEARRFVEDLRARLAANRPDRIRDLFPEWFPPTGPPADALDADPAGVEWSVPPVAERDSLDQWIAARNGVVTARELAPVAGEWL